MKKIAIIILFVLTGSVAFAQSPINFGIHAGWNDTKIKVKDRSVDSHGGYMFGAFLRLNLGDIYLEPALNFSSKESTLKNAGSEFKLKYNSIDVPIMVGYELLDLSLVKLRGFAGPVVSFLTKDVIKDRDSDKTMWNGKIGVGVDVWKAVLDVDYQFGLKKFGDGVKAPSSWNITLGFKIF